MPRHYDRAHPGTVTTPPKSNPEPYRGYLIHLNALNNSMWIEKDGRLIHRVPPTKSWAYARETIDGLHNVIDTNSPNRVSKMTITEVIVLARKQALTASANLYLADAVRLADAGYPDHAKIMALKSLREAAGRNIDDEDLLEEVTARDLQWPK